MVTVRRRFRYANYYRDANGTLYRDLVKASGILFLFNVQGKAGKFSIIQFSFNIGAGLALLGIVRFPILGLVLKGSECGHL